MTERLRSDAERLGVDIFHTALYRSGEFESLTVMTSHIVSLHFAPVFPIFPRCFLDLAQKVLRLLHDLNAFAPQLSDTGRSLEAGANFSTHEQTGELCP